MQNSALNTADARSRNLAAVFAAIRERPRSSRSEIGSEMPFSLQTMTNVVQELLDIGLVEEVERTDDRGRGNPHRGLQVVSSHGYALGVQFRWNSIHLVLVDLAFGIVQGDSRTLGVEIGDTEGYLAALEDTIAQYLRGHTEKDIWGIGLSGPIPIEVPNMPLHPRERAPIWSDLLWHQRFFADCTIARLRERLEKQFQLPVRIMNNPQAAGLGQSMVLPSGARFAYVLVGLGLTACFVTDRAVSQDVWRHGGELGHTIYRGRTLSSVVSATALRDSVQINLSQGHMETALETLARREPALFDPWLEEAAAILRFLVNFIEAALWPDGIALGGFLPTILLDRLIERASPLSESAVEPDGDPRRVMPRLYRALPAGESIPFGAAIGVLHHRANPEFSRLVAARRAGR